jgi:serine phosphatase RsbU (regulator of sigma subunit)
VFGEKVTQFLERTPLRFPADLESLFLDDYRAKSLPVIRISFAMGIALYAVFGVLDVFIAPQTRNITWLIRFAIVCPLMALSLALSWLRAFRRFVEIDTMVVGLFAGFGIIAMIAFSRDADATRYYYAGLILVLIYVYTFTKMRFVLASLTGWIIVLGYEAAAVGVLRMLGSHESFIVFLNNNFFFIAANIMGMIVCYYMELYARKDYLRRLLVIEKQDLLQAERNQLFDKNRLMKRELEMARRIQQALIPQKTPNANIYSLYRPMEEVGGDYFDFFEEEKKIGMFLSDVSGHGVPAAFITSMIKSSISQSPKLRADPAQMLCHLNGVLHDQTNDNFITAFYGIYDPRDKTLVYANAGHNPPYICLPNRVLELPSKQRHFPIALLGNKEMAERHSSYRNYQVALPPGSKLVLYTDGLVEVTQKSSRDVLFKEVIKEKMLRLRDLSPREFVDGLMQELILFRQGEDFDDDICLICMDVV